MISSPQGDLKHTGHVGLDGAYFGDISFLGGKYPHLPRQVVTPYKPQEDATDNNSSQMTSQEIMMMGLDRESNRESIRDSRQSIHHLQRDMQSKHGKSRLPILRNPPADPPADPPANPPANPLTAGNFIIRPRVSVFAGLLMGFAVSGLEWIFNPYSRLLLFHIGSSSIANSCFFCRNVKRLLFSCFPSFFNNSSCWKQAFFFK
jgi:hypothetical protein